jgi:hypothetical protein
MALVILGVLALFTYYQFIQPQISILLVITIFFASLRSHDTFSTIKRIILHHALIFLSLEIVFSSRLMFICRYREYGEVNICAGGFFGEGKIGKLCFSRISFPLVVTMAQQPYRRV